MTSSSSPQHARTRLRLPGLAAVAAASLAVAAPALAAQPSVRTLTPRDGATSVARDVGVAADLNLPNSGIDASTLSPATVLLVKTATGQDVPSNLNTSGGGDVIVLQPTRCLDPRTSYTFRVTSGLTDLGLDGLDSPDDVAFQPFTATFTTGNAPSCSANQDGFVSVPLGVPTDSYTSLTFGPDHNLYAGTIGGVIDRFPVNADGTLGAPTAISALAGRMVIGLAFDANGALWVSNTALAFTNGPDWSGKITRLSDPAFATKKDMVVGLPRSVRDHVTNSLAFHGGKLYVAQGSNSAMGAPDTAWGNRPEHALSAALLQIDVSRIGSPPLNVQTEGASPNYDPYAANAAVRIYADGIRNAFDMVWIGNDVYLPTNGSAAGGNTPASDDPSLCASQRPDNGPVPSTPVPALANVSQAQNDFLFRVRGGGTSVYHGYFGHPNPTRCEFVLGSGNDPSAPFQAASIVDYPSGTVADPAYAGYAYDFGKHKSPDGALLYRSNVAGGKWKDKIFVTRYSLGDDVIVLPVDGSGNIGTAQSSLPGLTGYDNPLDVTEDPGSDGTYPSGNLYLSQLPDDGAGTIFLLRPTDRRGRPAVTLAKTDGTGVLLGAAVDDRSSAQTVRLSNTGAGDLHVTGVSATGDFRATVDVAPPFVIPAGASRDVTVVFAPHAPGLARETLSVATADGLSASLPLTGLAFGPTGEPSLQDIVDAFGIPLTVGAPGGGPLASEVDAQAGLVKADASQDVTLQPIAAYASASDAAGNGAQVTWYPTGAPGSLLPVGGPAAASGIYPEGTIRFDPAAQRFSLAAAWATGQLSYQQDELNTWEPVAANQRKLHFLPIAANTYLVAFEDGTGTYDANDLVATVTNVQPATPLTPPGGGPAPPPPSDGGSPPSPPVPATPVVSVPAAIAPTPLAGATAPAACSITPPALGWQRGTLGLILHSTAPAGATVSLRSASGALLASGAAAAGGAVSLRIDTLQAGSGSITLTAAISGAAQCSAAVPLRIDNGRPRLVGLRLWRNGARRLVTFRPSEPTTVRLYAGGTQRTLRLSGKKRVTIALPAGRRTALLSLVDRAGNGTGQRIRFRL